MANNGTNLLWGNIKMYLSPPRSRFSVAYVLVLPLFLAMLQTGNGVEIGAGREFEISTTRATTLFQGKPAPFSIRTSPHLPGRSQAIAAETVNPLPTRNAGPGAVQMLKQEIIVTVIRSWLPYYGIDEHGEPTGFAIEVFQNVARIAGLRWKYLVVDVPADSFRAVADGRADVVPSLGITPKRMNTFAFTMPVETFGIAIFVRDETSDIRSSEDLRGRRVASVTGNIAVRILKNNKDIDLVVFDDVSSALVNLLAGRVDVLVYPTPIVLRLVRQLRLEKRIKQVGKPLVEVRRAIAVRRDDTVLLEKLSLAVESFLESTEYQRLYSKWFGTPKSFWTVQRVIWSAAGVFAVMLIGMGYWRFLTATRLNLDLRNQMAERRQTEESLRVSEERFRTLVEGSIQGIAIIQNYILRYANQALVDIYGYESADELIGKDTIKVFISPNDQDRIMSLVKRRLSGEVVSPVYEFQGVRKDGQMIWLQGLATTIDWKGEPAAQVTYFDITEQKKLEYQLRQSQKMEAIGTLAGGIAHDFNNLLQPIIGFTELAIEGLPPNSKVQRFLDTVSKSALRASDLVSQILLFSRGGQPKKQISDLVMIASEVIAFIKATLPASIDVRKEISVDTAPVFCDPSQIHQMLLNLCINAGQAIPDVGQVSISLGEVELDSFKCFFGKSLSGNYIRVAVMDTGIGMDIDTMARIFEPFFTTNKSGKGTGLGLSIVFGIIQEHDGGMQVTSQPGEGSTFEIFLPVIEERVEDQPLLENIVSTGKETILLIDDEEAIVELNQTSLEGYGYNVTTTIDSQEALEIFIANPDTFDLVITDLSMPKMSGVNLATEMRKIRANIPIIICTGNSEVISPESSIAQGINAFLYKPISNKELGRVVRRVLDEVG